MEFQICSQVCSRKETCVKIEDKNKRGKYPSLSLQKIYGACDLEFRQKMVRPNENERKKNWVSFWKKKWGQRGKTCIEKSKDTKEKK